MISRVKESLSNLKNNLVKALAGRLEDDMEAGIEEPGSESLAEALQQGGFASPAKKTLPVQEADREKMILGCEVAVGIHRDRPPYALFF